ncbi:hypothetical protein U9M48_000107, partial [Paspalum notatum var. saurae]
MRQRRWLELIKDYDAEIHYHPGKANVVAYALSEKSRIGLLWARELPDELAIEFDRLSLGFLNNMEGTVSMEFEPTLEQEIRKGQLNDEKIKEVKELIKLDKAPGFRVDADGTVWHGDRICVPNIKSIRDLILKEAHETAYSIHPGSEKMYQDLKQKFWWYGMKRELCVTFVERVKAEHQKPAGLLRPLKIPSGSGRKLRLHESMGTKLNFSSAYHPRTDGRTKRTNQILEDMLRACAIQYGTSWDKSLPYAEFSYNNSYRASIKMSPFRALYGRRCGTPLHWDQPGEKRLFGPRIIEDAERQVRMIRENLRIAQTGRRVMRITVEGIWNLRSVCEYTKSELREDELNVRDDLTYTRISKLNFGNGERGLPKQVEPPYGERRPPGEREDDLGEQITRNSLLANPKISGRDFFKGG